MSEPPPQRRSSRVPTKRIRLAEPLSSDDDSQKMDREKRKEKHRLSSGGLGQQSTTTTTTLAVQKAIMEKKKAEDDKVEAEKRKARETANAEQKKRKEKMMANLDFKKYIKQKVINLSSKGLNDDDLDILCKVIVQSTALEELHLHCNKLTLDDGKLANAIAKNTTLKVLWLSDNSINLQGVRHLANALKQNNKPLEDLDLDGNNIGDEGAKYIADMLAVNKTLQRITLDRNKIIDSGAQSIATSLFVNTGIRVVWLNDNSIGDKGAEKLADALESNHNIENLHLSGNDNISNRLMGRINTILKDQKRNNNDQVVTPSDNASTSININNRSSSSSIGMKLTPDQHQQMMDASQKAKQSSASSLTSTRGSISDQKMPASNNKRDTTKISAVSRGTDDDGIVITTPKGPSTSRELKVEVEDALKYMDRVRREFGDQSHMYNGFLEIMKDLKAQKVDTIGVITRVRRLFHGHIDLILGFNTFLPDGYKMELKEGYNPNPGRESQPPKKRQRLSEPIIGGPNPQRMNFDPLSSSPDSSKQLQLDFDNAIDYVTTIKKRFAPDIYRKFLQILAGYIEMSWYMIRRREH